MTFPKPGRRRNLLLGLAAAGLVAALLPVAGTAIAEADQSPTARFDYSVPEGLKPDLDGNGVPDLPVPRSVIHRDQFMFTLDGCSSSSPISTIVLLEWTVTFPNGVERLGGRPCRVSLAAPAQGVYPVTLKVTDGNGQTATTTGSVTIRDILIVSMGDSYASGEGNPDRPSEVSNNGGPVVIGPPTWADKACHRSWKSAPALAAAAIERADWHTSVTFVSVACSGAKITNGLLDVYPDPPGAAPGDAPLVRQVEQMRRLLCPREDSRLCLGPFRTEPRHIDALLLGVGGNDLGFGPIIRKCAERGIQGPDCQHRPDVLSQVASGLAGLPNSYRALKNEINRTLSFSTAYITEYPDPTHGADRDVCPEIRLVGAGGPFDGLIDRDEVAWAYEALVWPLNQAVSAAAADNGWRFVGGLADASLTHGYCTADRWFTQYPESIRTQQTEHGTLHPNRLGQHAAGQLLTAAIRPNL